MQPTVSLRFSLVGRACPSSLILRVQGEAGYGMRSEDGRLGTVPVCRSGGFASGKFLNMTLKSVISMHF